MSSRRIERCYTDNIYLIESLPPEEEYPYERNYLIMGNSGNTYTVTISNEPSCTCPDYTSRGNRCKHIYFVLIRIMNIYDYTEEYYTDDELAQMFLNIPQVAKDLMYQGERPTEQKEVNQKFEKDDVCPICLDPLENGKELDYCKYSCGKTIHKKCFSMWEKSKGGICVFCRGKWYSDFPSKPKVVSMHPIEPIPIEEKEEDKKDISNNTEGQNNNDYEKIEIDEDNNIINDNNNGNNDDEVMNEGYSKDKKEKKRKKRKNKFKSRSRNRSRDKNKSRKMSISSTSRSRSRSRNRNRSRSYNKIKYPKD